MSEGKHLVFWLFAGTAMATGGWVVVVMLVLALLSLGSLGQRISTVQMIGMAIVLVTAVACVLVPVIHIVQRLRHMAVPFAWRAFGWFAAPVAAGLGTFSIFRDPGDALWFGVPLLAFGVALMGLCALQAKEFG